MRRLMLALAALAPLVLPAASHAESFTPAQRAEIVAILRDALTRDPTILRDAVLAMQRAETAHEADTSAQAIAQHRAALVSDSADPIAGNPAGSRTVVEFYDPRCPYCRQMLPVLAALIHADPQVRVVYKDIPVLGPDSTLDAEALVAAQAQGGYLALQDALMHDPAPPSKARIGALATAAHLDPNRLLHDMDGPAVHDRIAANLALAQSLGIQGTPAIVIGDQMMPGAVPLETLQAAVKAAG